MVEISLSGSGEGLGRVTSQPTLHATFQPENGHPGHAATRAARHSYFPCVLSPHGGMFLSGERQYFTSSSFRAMGLQEPRKVFLRQCHRSWRDWYAW
jgi:hypothetical protein